jgi:hypothetical protein
MKLRWKRTAITASAIGALALVTTAAVAAATMSSLPPEQKQGPTAFMSGGAGADQRAAMKHAASGYPLELEFVHGIKRAREYLSGVHVDIKGANGQTALKTVSDGPLLLAKLPTGRYSVSATNAGHTETKNVTIADGKHQRLLFDWK